MDMGREWLNSLWDEFTRSNGIVCEYTTPYAHQQNGAAERSMRTILDTARSMLADSGLPTKYWADAVQTAVYIRNFVPSSRSPHVVPLERWTGQKQDVSHLRPFGSTAYAHIPLDLGMSKWAPRSMKVSMIGYYGRDGYKLLNTENGAVVKSRDIIFEEGLTHLAEPPTRTVLTHETDPFVKTTDKGETELQTEAAPKVVPDQIVTAPRPLRMTDLHTAHEDTTEKPATPAVPPAAAPPPTPQTRPLDADDLPIALRRNQRERRITEKLRESLEYLKNASAHVAVADSDVWIPKTYQEAMSQPDLWLGPMQEELEMLKERGVYKVVPRPANRNVVKSKWVFVPKFDGNGALV